MNKGIRFTDEFKQVVERGYAVSEVASILFPSHRNCVSTAEQ